MIERGQAKGWGSLDHLCDKVHKGFILVGCVSLVWGGLRGHYCSSRISRRKAQNAALSSSVSIGGYLRNLPGFVRFGGLDCAQVSSLFES